MKITLQALVEREDGTHKSVALCTLERDPTASPSSGLVLCLAETRELCEAPGLWRPHTSATQDLGYLSKRQYAATDVRISATGNRAIRITTVSIFA
jgi:hypothetical protein